MKLEFTDVEVKNILLNEAVRLLNIQGEYKCGVLVVFDSTGGLVSASVDIPATAVMAYSSNEAKMTALRTEECYKMFSEELAEKRR